MTKLKDRLSASVRMAKAAQQAAADPSAPELPATPNPTEVKSAGDGPAAEKASAARPEAPRAAAAKGAPSAAAKATPTAGPSKGPRKPAAGSASGSDEVPESGSALFPARIWPD